MNTKTIFKTLAMAMMMPAMMLNTACSSDDDAIVNNPENNNQKGYAIPVTINVTREGDATTRATYNEGDKTLSFEAGDKLFVAGSDATAGQFAGTLECVSEGTFSGTIYTENSYSGTADALLTSSNSRTATLLPDGYSSIGYLSISNPDSYNATLATDATKAFATTKAAAVEQLSLEQATTYSSGFSLAPQNAILNFTVKGLTTGSTDVSLQVGSSTTISGSVTPESGTATFAMAVAHSATASSLTLTVAGTAVSLGSHALSAGKIYNQKLQNVRMFTNIPDGEKWILYGTSYGAPFMIGDGATVTLSGVSVDGVRVMCNGSATVILADGTTNTLNSGINGGDGKTLTIKGTGMLIATGPGAGGAAIGSSDEGSCGDIIISGGNITANGGYHSAGIGAGGYEKSCGNITINGGIITATGDYNSAGIGGGGEGGSCGDITITTNVTSVTATAGSYSGNAPKSIGAGGGSTVGTCGTVTVGGTSYPDGISTSPFTYPAPTLANTMTHAGMTVKVNFNYADEENYCLFASNGDGTYTFLSGDGWAGGDADKAKALVVENDKLVFKQNHYDKITKYWDTDGYSVTFDTSNSTYSEWVGGDAKSIYNPSFISVKVNGTTISLSKASKITVDDLDKVAYQSWVVIVSNNSGKIYFDDDGYVRRCSDGAMLKQCNDGEYWYGVGDWESYDPYYSYKFDGD